VLPNDGEQPGSEQPQTARAGEDEWIRTPIEERYQAGMRIAADARSVRSRQAAGQVIKLAHHLAGDERAQAPAGDSMWSVRGQNRRRETFGNPHPADFRGTGKLPPEFPETPGN
jgi:hypothetical protein